MARKKRTNKAQARKEASWEKLISRRGKYNPGRPYQKRKSKPQDAIKNSLKEGFRGSKNSARSALKEGFKGKANSGKGSVKLTSIDPEFVLGGQLFNPQSIRHTFNDDFAMMRREYSRLRPVAMKRLQRLKRSDFANSDTYKNYKDTFKKLKELDNQQLPAALSELNRFLDSSLSTITGQRNMMEQRIQTLQEYGYDINERNFWLVMDILEYLRAHYQGIIYDSDTQIEEATHVVNEILRDDTASFKNKTVSQLGELVYERYKVARGELFE